MIPGDRLVCVFAEPHEPGDCFLTWPLHITVVPWFRAEIGSDALAAAIGKHVASITPFVVTMGSEAHFGRQGRKLVSLVELPSPLETLERQVRAVLRTYDAWIVDETTKRRQPFRPHVTAQGDERLFHGDSFVCDQLYIVEQLGGTKTVAGAVRLGI